MLSKVIKKIADLVYAPSKDSYKKTITKEEAEKYFDEPKWMKYLVKGEEQYFSDIPDSK